MTGIDILAMEEVAIEFAFNWKVFWMVVVVFAVVGFVVSTWYVVKGECRWMFVPSIVVPCAAFGVLLGYMLGSGTHTPTKYETQYKVTISDEVKMTDFLERYEIIDTEGKIYTIRERGADTK